MKTGRFEAQVNLCDYTRSKIGPTQAWKRRWKFAASRINAMRQAEGGLADGLAVPEREAVGWDETLEPIEQSLEDGRQNVRMEKYLEQRQAARPEEVAKLLELQKAADKKARRDEERRRRLEQGSTQDPRKRINVRLEERRAQIEDDPGGAREGSIREIQRQLPTDVYRCQRANGIERIELVDVNLLAARAVGLSSGGNSKFQEVAEISRAKERREKWEAHAFSGGVINHVRRNRLPGSASTLSRSAPSLELSRLRATERSWEMQTKAQEQRRAAYQDRVSSRMCAMRSRSLVEDVEPMFCTKFDLGTMLAEIAEAAREGEEEAMRLAEVAHLEAKALAEEAAKLAAETPETLKAPNPTPEVAADEDDDDDDDFGMP